MRRIIAGILVAFGSGHLLAQPAEIGSTICCGANGCGVTALKGYIQSQAHAVDRLNASDDELNRTYAAVLAAYAELPDAVAAIRKAQRAWIQLRDLDLEATRLSWARQADIEAADVRESVLFAGIRESWNLDRARYLCQNYLTERG